MSVSIMYRQNNGFQLLSVDGQFSKTQPHILCISKLCTYQSYKLHLLTKGSDKRGCTVAGKLCGRINQFFYKIANMKGLAKNTKWILERK